MAVTLDLFPLGVKNGISALRAGALVWRHIPIVSFSLPTS
jgi:hypothetical protein